MCHLRTSACSCYKAFYCCISFSSNGDVLSYGLMLFWVCTGRRIIRKVKTVLIKNCHQSSTEHMVKNENASSKLLLLDVYLLLSRTVPDAAKSQEVRNTLLNLPELSVWQKSASQHSVSLYQPNNKTIAFPGRW